MTHELLVDLTRGMVVLIAGGLLIIASQKLIGSLTRKHRLPPTMVYVIKALVRWGLVLLILFLFLESFGVSLRAVWAGLLSVVVLIAVAFVAGWSVLSNILCSVLLLLFSKARIGDIVEIKETKLADAGVRGKIIDVNLFFVTLEEDVAEPSLSPKPATMQVPCHLFFFRVVRCWEGTDTQPLSEGFTQRQDEKRAIKKKARTKNE